MSGHWFSAAFASCRFEVQFVFVGDDQVHEAEGGRKGRYWSAALARRLIMQRCRAPVGQRCRSR